MPRVSREQTERNRLLIEAASARLFKEHGLNGVSVADIMAGAGLTHGGFYGHFESKDELASIACARAFEESAARWEAFGEHGATEQAALATLAKHYLSAKQRDDPGFSCPAHSLAADVGREEASKPVRSAYARGLKTLLGVLMSYSKARRTRRERRRALARMSMLVGAVTLARAVRGDPLSDEILEAAREHLALEAR
ncbi:MULTISPECIES: TetR family transcriptional regulator [unclassified Caballeronia]|uniref:TetR/AcrR family transcriptional regulator n=1 Tax=unclassified Caballeronia TaxID=2646786 RepID=UPI00285783E6|nr:MULTISPECIES: TetR family transcriptional regulator [unclassified Caballeronia]MDR5753254.1 TetR family transcriptional regulator [Caballeronia sp. LZ024]MDR5840993.1 TetR family transcriptional regulator [Caballeronia sp. LZ031]